MSPLGKNRAASKRLKAITLWRSSMPSLARAHSWGLTCCQGPVRIALASILTSMGVERGAGLSLQVPPFPGMAKQTLGFSSALAGSKPHTMT